MRNHSHNMRPWVSMDVNHELSLRDYNVIAWNGSRETVPQGEEGVPRIPPDFLEFPIYLTFDEAQMRAREMVTVHGWEHAMVVRVSSNNEPINQVDATEYELEWGNFSIPFHADGVLCECYVARTRPSDVCENESHNWETMHWWRVE